MKFLKVLSLFAALALLGGAVVNARYGIVDQMLGAAPDAGKAKSANTNVHNSEFLGASKSAPLIRAPPQQAAQPQAQQAPPAPAKDGG